MKQYVIGDVHGHFSLLRKTLDWVETQSPGEVIFLGDYIDRGLQNKQVVELLMGGPPEDWKWTIIRGNHEDMAIDAHRYSSESHFWLINGGDRTLEEYGGEKLPDDVVEWMNSLPRYHYDKHRIFTHAYASETSPLAAQPSSVTQWMRPATQRDDYPIYGRYLVHGHTPQKGKAFIGEHRANLDVGGVWTNTLVVAVFDSKLAGPPIHTETVTRHLE